MSEREKEEVECVREREQEKVWDGEQQAGEIIEAGSATESRVAGLVHWTWCRLMAHFALKFSSAQGCSVAFWCSGFSCRS